MTPFLQRYIAHMVSLGINFEQARGSATRTLRKHVELLGTSYEVQQKDAAKVFRESIYYTIIRFLNHPITII